MAKRILIVDDNIFVRHLIRSFIEAQTEFDVCGEAVDGVEAITKTEELQPDLIVLDFSMPRMNGLDAAKALRPITLTVPKILFTLHKDSRMEALARAAGIGSVFSKTDGMSALITEIKRLLQPMLPAHT